MGIQKIKINNFKSLKNIDIRINDTDDIYCLLGKNGVGKSNIIDAIEYFYDCLNDKIRIGTDYIDNINIYTQKFEIEIIYDLKNLKKINANIYIQDIMKRIKHYIRKDKLILRLTEYKDGSREWYPDDKDLRKYIRKVFPIYLIDTRFIQLQDWSKIWDIISELSISNIKVEETEIHTKLDDLFKSVYGEKYSKTIKKIENVFDEENILINTSDYNTRIKNVFLTRLGGEEFLNKGNKLSYYSDGLNSLKYIKLLTRLIGLLSETGWKNPLILMDEPEIGLHPYYIQELMEGLKLSANYRLKLILSTHSPHLVNNAIKNNIKVSLNRVYLKNDYSFLEHINEIIEQKDKFLISTKETECYFSNAIVFLEGKSEMQVFCHPEIINLFGYIKKINLYPYNSDNNSMGLVHPGKNNLNIPYIVIIDMDKIITYHDKKNIFKIKADNLVNPLSNDQINKKEIYLYYEYGNRKHWTYNLKRRLKKALEKSKFEQNFDRFWIEDRLFENILNMIKIYCAKYNILPLNTTIEGTLVNRNNIEIVIKWLETVFEPIEMQKLMTLLEEDIKKTGKKNLRYRTTIVRLILNGKLDNLKTLKEAQTNNYIDGSTKKEIENFNKNIGSKTDGWIISFIDYYFVNYISEIENEEDKKKVFKNNFNELYSILQYFEYVIQSK